MRIIPVFIHYRGCPHRCIYCNEELAAGPPTANLDRETVEDIIGAHLGRYGREGKCQVAFYGGNFTGMDREMQDRLLSYIQPHITAGDVTGIRISTRPDALDHRDAARLKSLGVRTVELGAQSLDDGVLEEIRRGHTAADVEKAVTCLRAVGLEVGLHLMVGLPGDDGCAFERTVERVVALRPDTVRIHPTLVFRDTPLAEAFLRGAYQPLSLEAAVAACKGAVKRFREVGIAVIRLGLHETRQMREPGSVLGGARHEAFGALVASAIYLDKIVQLLDGREVRGREVTFTVPPRDISAFRGHSNANIRFLKEHFGMTAVRVVPGPSLTCHEGAAHA